MADQIVVLTDDGKIKGIRATIPNSQQLDTYQASGTTGNITNTEASIGSVANIVALAGDKFLITATLTITKDTGTTARTTSLKLRRGTTTAATQIGVTTSTTSPGTASVVYGPLIISFVDTPGAGTFSYGIFGLNSASSTTVASGWSLTAVKLNTTKGDPGVVDWTGAPDASKMDVPNSLDTNQVSAETNQVGDTIPVFHMAGIVKAVLAGLPGDGGFLAKNLTWSDPVTGGQTKLPTPTFGTVTKDDTSFTLPITNLPSGAAVVWTVDGVTDTDTTGATLSKSGLAASSTHSVTAKFTQSGYTESDVASTSITTNASSGGGGGATLLRTVKMSLQSDYGAPSGVAGWNDLQISQAAIKAVNGYTSAALKDTTGATTPFTLTNPKVWNNSVMNILGAGYPSTALYPASLGDTGIQSGSWSTPPGLKILSTDPTKYYKLYVGCLSDGSSDVINIIVGGVTKTKNIYNNYGSNTEAELASTMWTVFSNVQGSSITIDFSQNTNGSYFGLNCIILEEYDNATT